MRLFIFIICFGVFSFSACNSSNEQKQKAANQEYNEHEHLHDHGHEIIREINLNNGEKWELQKELMTNVIAMELAIENYNKATEKDHLALAQILDAETNKLVSDCTMKGQSHNELHKWLEPHMAMIKDLKTVKFSNEAKPIVQELEASFSMLRMYFE